MLTRQTLVVKNVVGCFAILAGLVTCAMTYVAASVVASLVAIADDSHERLRVRNTFQTPDEVVRYYVGRDASGFVWSGLLEIERKAFTTWAETAAHETFFVSSSVSIGKPSIKSDHAQVEVIYRITGMGDAFGARLPAPPPPEKKVTFGLVKQNGQWKINEPKPQALAPVVLDSKFR